MPTHEFSGGAPYLLRHCKRANTTAANNVSLKYRFCFKIWKGILQNVKGNDTQAVWQAALPLELNESLIFHLFHLQGPDIQCYQHL